MKNLKIKATIAGLSLVTAMSANAFANEVMLINETTDVMPINEADNSSVVLISEQGANLYINGTAASVNAKDFNGVTMLPLRSICEALGMTVTWEEASRTIILEKLPVYITLTPDADGYTFAKTAPTLLGSAPVLENGTTYVPVNFATEILGAELTNIDGIITINTEINDENAQEAPVAPVNEAVYTGMEEEALSLYDFNLGEVVAQITEDTVITDADGNAIKADAIAEGSLLEVKYAEFMTMSLPPITNALEIKVIGAETFEMMTATVCGVEEIKPEGGEAYTAITVGDKEDVASQTVLNLASDKKLIGADGEAIAHSEIAEGNEIMAAVSTISTRSLPPQRNVQFVRIVK